LDRLFHLLLLKMETSLLPLPRTVLFPLPQITALALPLEVKIERNLERKHVTFPGRQETFPLRDVTLKDLLLPLEMELSPLLLKTNREALRLADSTPLRAVKRSLRVVRNLKMLLFARRDISRLLLQLLEILLAILLLPVFYRQQPLLLHQQFTPCSFKLVLQHSQAA
jgi:hypothetical protein